MAWLPNMSVEAWVAEACRRAGRNLSVQEWLQYIDNTPRQTCPEFPPGE
ncbi:MAG: hypothetical protein ACT4QE_10500 [Anaerolineales bacterium]